MGAEAGGRESDKRPKQENVGPVEGGEHVFCLQNNPAKRLVGIDESPPPQVPGAGISYLSLVRVSGKVSLLTFTC